MQTTAAEGSFQTLVRAQRRGRSQATMREACLQVLVMKGTPTPPCSGAPLGLGKGYLGGVRRQEGGSEQTWKRKLGSLCAEEGAVSTWDQQAPISTPVGPLLVSGATEKRAD